MQQPRVHQARLYILLIVCGALGFAVFYAVNRVGAINLQANILDTCLHSSAAIQATPSCAAQPLSVAEVDGLRDNAQTMGEVGWVSFLLLIFGFGSTLLDYFRG